MDFHNWLHKVTEVPVRPSRQVVRERLEAYGLAHDLFTHASVCAMLIDRERKMRLAEAESDAVSRAVAAAGTTVDRQFLHEPIQRHFGKYLEALERLADQPSEDRLVIVGPELLEEERLPATVIELKRQIGTKAIDFSLMFAA